VRDDQHRGAGVGAVAKVLHQPGTERGVDAGRRLVEDQDRLVADKRPGDDCPLLLPAGQLEHALPGEITEADRLERPLDLLALLRPGARQQ
jgi:hypothetical protein